MSRVTVCAIPAAPGLRYKEQVHAQCKARGVYMHSDTEDSVNEPQPLVCRRLYGS
jgi:hypothetical protein